MSSGYRVKTVMLTSGERLPMLLDRDGMPMFDPTMFALTELRGRNRSDKSIEESLIRMYDAMVLKRPAKEDSAKVVQAIDPFFQSA